MNDIRELVLTKACIVRKILERRMKWAGHMVRLNDERLPKRSESKKQEGCRKRGRRQLRWEDCVNATSKKGIYRMKKTGEKVPTTGLNGFFSSNVAVQRSDN